jgi:hypothetical protein
MCLHSHRASLVVARRDPQVEYEQGQIAKREAAAAAASSGKYGSNAPNGDDDAARDQGAFAAEDDFPQTTPRRYARVSTATHGPA